MSTIHPPTNTERERRRPCGCPFHWRHDGNVIHLRTKHHMHDCPEFPEIRWVPFDDVPEPRGGAS